MLFYFPWQNQLNRIYKCNLPLHSDLDKIREWVLQHKPNKHNSTHWRYNTLPADISLLYYTVATNKNIINMFIKAFGKNYNIDIINDMNEIYVTPVDNRKYTTSDKICYTRHIDGPYYLFPFASCYSILIGLDDNSNVLRRFNMTQKDNNVNIMKKGDVLAYDYHRESNHICEKYNDNNDKYDNNDNNDKYDNYDNYDNLQVVLKIHYCVYPRKAYYFGKALGILSAYYNNAFRNLFLFTLNTNNEYKNMLIYLMIINTKIFHDIEYHIGFNNISFLTLLFYISKITHYNIFLFGCLAIYYLRKIKNIPDNCNICVLKRDLRFYYTVYSLQIYYIYVKNLLFTSLYASYFTSIIFFTFLYYDLKYLSLIFS